MIYLLIMIFLNISMMLCMSCYVHHLYVILCTSLCYVNHYFVIFIIKLICQVLSYMFGHGSKDHIKIRHETSYFNIIIMQCAIFSEFYLTLLCMSLTQFDN